MSEYVFRTDKPIKYCYECPINNSENGRCELGVATYGLDVPKHCPLKELPPHGKLIDADLAEEVMREVGKIHTSLLQRSMIEVAINTLKSAPIILEASEE